MVIDSSSDDEDIYGNYETYKKRKMHYIVGRMTSTKSNSENGKHFNDAYHPEENIKPESADEDDDLEDSMELMDRLNKRTTNLNRKRKNSESVNNEIEALKEELLKESHDEKIDKGSKSLKIATLQSNFRILLEEIDQNVKQKQRALEENSLFEKTDLVELERLDNASSIIRCSINLMAVEASHSFNKLIRWDMELPFSELFSKYAPEIRIPVEEMAVYCNDKKCEPSDTPLSIGLSDQEVNQLDIFRISDPNLNTINVKWQLKDHRPVMRRIKRDISFSKLKEEYCREEKLKPQKCYLIFDGDRVDENDTPQSLDMEDDDCIDVHQIL
uniref:Ubiquitin-like domain-containing protein n=1 Tax=Acrobeloides nanus TaxID=290746 RepID=A0A914EP31_9BILA